MNRQLSNKASADFTLGPVVPACKAVGVTMLEQKPRESRVVDPFFPHTRELVGFHVSSSKSGDLR